MEIVQDGGTFTVWYGGDIGEGQVRYDLNLWIGHPPEGATYLPS
jgi:hypothetical protein